MLLHKGYKHIVGDNTHYITYLGTKSMSDLPLTFQLPFKLKNKKFDLYESSIKMKSHGHTFRLKHVTKKYPSIVLNNAINCEPYDVTFVLWHEYLHVTLPKIKVKSKKDLLIECFPSLSKVVTNISHLRFEELCVIIMSCYDKDIDVHISNLSKYYNGLILNDLKTFKIIRNQYIKLGN